MAHEDQLSKHYEHAMQTIETLAKAGNEALIRRAVEMTKVFEEEEQLRNERLAALIGPRRRRRRGT